MGTYATLLAQCAMLAAAFGAIAWAAPADAKLWVAAAGALSIVFFTAISLRRHQQIRRLSADIDEVLHNGRHARFEKCREGDVAVLANELEKMVARLARTTEQLQQERNALADALADVSHQIRTPLTAAELMLPAIERMDDPAQRKRAIRELEEMLERVAWLVTTLLKIAKVDAGAITAQAAEVDVVAMLSRATAPLEIAFDLHDVTLEVSVAPGVRFTGDALWTAEALENILKNCMEHTPAGGTVRVEATENALATTLTITDTGPGISPADLPHVFDRFYRGREGAPDRPEGFGIGLALAQALISVQGGTLRASNAEPVGARFQISFPKLIV